MVNQGNVLTFSQAWTNLTSGIVKPHFTLFNFASQNATNLIDVIQSTDITLTNQFRDPLIQNLSSVRSQVNSALSTLDSAFYLSFIPSMAQTINSPYTDLNLAWTDIYEHFVDQSYEVLKRDMTYGAVASGGSNTGDGFLYECTTNKYGFVYDLGIPFDASGTATFYREVIQDAAQTGTEGKSRIRAYASGAPPFDSLVDVRSGANASDYFTIDYRDSILQNANFKLTGTSPTLTNWWASGADYTGIVQSTSASYWAEVGSKTATAQSGRYYNMSLTHNAAPVYQNISTSFRDDVPYVILLVIKASTTANIGKLYYKLGSKTWSHTPTTTDFEIVTPTRDKYIWYRNFAASPLTFEIYRSGGSAGTILISAVVVCPFPFYNNLKGAHEFVLRGNTDFIKGDYFTSTNTIGANPGTTQTYLAKSNFSLPSAASASAETPDYS